MTQMHVMFKGFAADQLLVDWTNEVHDLLELAETQGLKPNYGCRSGFCGCCKVQIEVGKVRLLVETSIDLADDEVLLCCSVPESNRLVLSMPS